MGVASLAAWGGLRRLPRIIGTARAKALVFTAGHIDAVRAEQIGLVTAVATDTGLDTLGSMYCDRWPQSHLLPPNGRLITRLMCR
jgi:enoyl-CoA hydratase/carnithine racemase